MPEGGPEIPRVEELVGEGEEERDGYGRRVAVATVVTTLIGALVAFAQAGALQTHDKADQRAEKYGSLALSAGQIDRGKAEVQIDRLNLLTQQIRAADNASLFIQYGQGSSANHLTAARWNTIATQTEADTKFIAASQGIRYICSPSLQTKCPTVNASYSPELDPRFPTRYLEASQWQAYDDTALRDAANEEADTAEGQFVHYAAALAMLAVAVFLLGYSLTPQGRARYRLYATVAGGLVLVGGTWALVQALSPVSHSPNRAASSYAYAKVELNSGEYPEAVADFSTAIRLRPHFVDAYVGRGEAEVFASIPHTSSGGTALPTTAGPQTLPTAAAIDAAVRDDEHARDEGSSSATLLFDLGRNLLLRGLLEHNTADIQSARTDLSQSITGFNSQINARYSTAGAELRVAEADIALRRPTAMADLRRAARTLLAPNVPLEPAIAPSLTDLSLIETTRPALASSVNAARLALISIGDLAGGTLNGKTPTGTGGVQFRGVQVQPDPGHLLWTASNVGTYQTTKDVLNVQWEYQDPIHHEWAVLPELSGPVGPGGLQRYGADGIASNNASYVSSSSPATCLPPGLYKVELYVDGQLAGTATSRATWPALQAVRFSDTEAAVCVPEGWRSFGDAPGRDGYTAPDGSGTLILSVPKQATGGLSSSPAGLVTVMHDAVSGFSGGGGPLPGLAASGKAGSTQFFMSAGNGEQQQWTYKNGYVDTGIGTSANGQIYVGITWGPTPNLVQNLFLSLSPL